MEDWSDLPLTEVTSAPCWLVSANAIAEPVTAYCRPHIDQSNQLTFKILTVSKLQYSTAQHSTAQHSTAWMHWHCGARTAATDLTTTGQRLQGQNLRCLHSAVLLQTRPQLPCLGDVHAGKPKAQHQPL